MFTFTAPSDKGEHRLPSGDVCPCTPPGGVDLARWNASHSRRWNHLRTLLRREFPGVEFIRGVEVQDRGALHDHVVAYFPGGRLPSVSFLRSLAIRAGFGHSVDVAPCEPGSKKAAYYVSKYVTKACDQRSDVPWWGEVVDRRTGELSWGVTEGRYRTWSSSRAWGITMAEARAEAADYARVKAAEREQESLALLEKMLGAVVVPSPTSWTDSSP